MKITLLVAMVSIMILAIIGCDNDNDKVSRENNITEVKEQYKTIIVPVVKQSDILYTPVNEAYKSITVPIIKESDLQ